MLGSMKLGFSGVSEYLITDLTAVTATGAVSFSYIAMPGGPRTLQNYIASFGVVATDLNTNTSLWQNSYSGDIPYIDNPITGNNYFTEYGRVRIIEGDGTTDGPDRTVFNFGRVNGGASFGNLTSNKNFGGARLRSGNNGDLGMTDGWVWGFSPATGWVACYKLPISVLSTSFIFNNGKWFEISPGFNQNYTLYGKRRAYSYYPITHIGFSVN